MAFSKITDADTTGKGNLGRPDTPGVTAAEMQRILDELPREVIIPKFNTLIDALEDTAAAAQIGAAEGEAATTVQAALDDRYRKGETYSRAEADAAIDAKVVAIGTGDMAMAVYDPMGKRLPYLPAAEGLDRASYGGSADGVVAAADTAAQADRLAAPVRIGEADFDGSADLTLAEIGAATAAQGALAERAMPKSGGAFTGIITGPSAAMTRLQAEDALYFSGSGNYGVKADGAAGYLWTWGLAGLKVTDNAGTPKPVIASNTSGASSRRYKQEIKPLTDAQARLLLQLRPVSFTYIPALHDPGAKYGLIAEELQAIDPTCVYLDGEGRADGINYTMLVPQLIRLCQLLQQQIDALAQRLAALEQPDAAQPAAAKESAQEAAQPAAAQEAAQADAPDAAAQGGDPDGV